jgi:hypothetical protein
MMILFVIRFFDFLLSGVLSGMLIIIWIVSYRQDPSYDTYLETHQVFIKTYQKRLPFLGVATILLTLSSALLQNNIVSIYLIISTILLFGAEIITRKGMQALNKQIMRWSKERMPNKWKYVMDKWWHFHIARTVFTLLGFILIILSSL